MANALFAFETRGAGQRAVDRLAGEGLPPRALQLHVREGGPNDKLVEETDELATGGFVRNFLDMFQGIFEWGDSPHDASVYAQTVRRGGSVVSVDTAAAAERNKVDEVMQTAGCTQRTGWRDVPLPAR